MAFKEPLYLPTKMPSPDSEPPVSTTLTCLLCEESFDESQTLMTHILEEHSLVIEDVPGIADLQGYLKYWRQRFISTEMSWICASIDTTEGKRFHMLTKTLPEDEQLRNELRRVKQEEILKPLLEQKRSERADEAKTRNCLFCRKTFQGNPHQLFQHMYTDHNFNVGRADNLVYVDDFLTLLQDKLKNLVCLYCEKTFKSWEVLKEHMRKKQHKQLNPNNKTYDKFYIVNYLIGENKNERDFDHDDGKDKFEDWTEEQRFDLVCLFCELCEKRWDDIFAHMKLKHFFDFGSVRKGLGFYDQVKLVNYIRRQTHISVCYMCELQCDSRQSLLCHIEDTHQDGTAPCKSLWDQPGYFFPTYENDQLLLALEDNKQETNEEWVLPEDTVQPNTKLLEQLSLDDNVT